MGLGELGPGRLQISVAALTCANVGLMPEIIRACLCHSKTFDRMSVALHKVADVNRGT